MPPEPDRRWPIIAGDVALAALVVLAAAPIHMLVEAPWRPFVERTAATVILAVVLRQVCRVVHGDLAGDPPSSFDAALVAPRPEPVAERRLAELESAVGFALRSRRSFERLLWPRVSRLARHPLPPPPPRRWRRGPSLDELRALVRALEESR
jgi:hypothetical protein